jgi:pimeloyl-ACP methyl ester carboxylesterase
MSAYEAANRLEPLRLQVGPMTFDALAAGPSEGPLVLLLHGWPQFADSWAAVATAVGSDGYRAVAVDQRGYSPGARPAETGDYAVARLVEDVMGFADALGQPRFHLVAHDWGAIVGWSAAASHPERVASFASFATPHPRALAEAVANDPDQQKRSAYVQLFRQPGGVAENALLANGAARLREAYQGKVSPEAIDQNVRRLAEPGALTATLNWYRALDWQTEVGTVSVPTLYAWGTRDLALGERAARATAGHVSGPYRFEVLDGTSHWILDEAPERVASLVREHLASHRAA